MKLSYAELHSPIFHAGKNFRDKIFADKETELELITINLENLVMPFVKFTFRGKTTFLPLTSINHITGQNELPERPVNIPHALCLYTTIKILKSFYFLYRS